MTEIMPVPRNLILLSYQQGAFRVSFLPCGECKRGSGAERTKKFGKSPSFQRLFCVDSHKKRLTACVPHGIISTCVGMSHGICHTVRRDLP